MILFNSLLKSISAFKALSTNVESAGGDSQRAAKLKKDGILYLIGRLIISLVLIGAAIYFFSQSDNDQEKIKFGWFCVGLVGGFWLS